jgi:hypothetical protein
VIFFFFILITYYNYFYLTFQIIGNIVIIICNFTLIIFYSVFSYLKVLFIIIIFVQLLLTQLYSMTSSIENTITNK